MMSKAYRGLVDTGYVSSQKRDILLEASRDVEYIQNTPSRFFEAGADAHRDRIGCAVLLIDELIQMGLCSLATYEKGKPKVIERTSAELAVLLTEGEEMQHVGEYFLVATTMGKEWVRRYEALVGELDAPKA